MILVMWQPIDSMKNEPAEYHLFVVLSNGRMTILDRRNIGVVDKTAMYVPIPDPPKVMRLFVEPDAVADSWIDPKTKDNNITADKEKYDERSKQQ